MIAPPVTGALRGHRRRSPSSTSSA
jgi:hypothetical protein